VYKWQVFLGGIASATILLAGAAAPALAQTVDGSPLTTLTQTMTGSQVSGNACNLAGLPMAGQVNSAVAGVTGQSCAAADDPWQASSDSTDSSTDSTGPSTMTSALPGLSTVTGEIPGLSSMSSTLPELNPASSQDSSSASDSTIPVTTPLSGANQPGLGSSQNSLGSDQSGTGSSVLPGSLNGVTSAVPAGSLTNGLPNLGTVTAPLSGITGQPQN
jgi:hypothetical protein